MYLRNGVSLDSLAEIELYSIEGGTYSLWAYNLFAQWEPLIEVTLEASQRKVLKMDSTLGFPANLMKTVSLQIRSGQHILQNISLPYPNTIAGMSLSLLGDDTWIQTQASLGSVNSWEAKGLSFSEIHYHPEEESPHSIEFIEITKSLESSLDPEGGTLEVKGVGLEISLDSLLPGQSLVFSRDFLAGSQGLYNGKLSNAGERLQLLLHKNQTTYLLDEVLYFDDSPWPRECDGKGKSLQRLASSSGLTPEDQWFCETPTPGT